MTLRTPVTALMFAVAGATVLAAQDVPCSEVTILAVPIIITKDHVEGKAQIPNEIVPVCPKGRVVWTFVNDAEEDIEITVHRFQDVTDPQNKKGADDKVKFHKGKKKLKLKDRRKDFPSGSLPSALDGEPGTCLKYTITVRGDDTEKTIDHDPRLQLTDPVIRHGQLVASARTEGACK